MRCFAMESCVLAREFSEFEDDNDDPAVPDKPAPPRRLPISLGLELLLAGCGSVMLLGLVFLGCLDAFTGGSPYPTTICELTQNPVFCSEPLRGVTIEALMAALVAIFATIGLEAIYYLAWRRDVFSNLRAFFIDPQYSFLMYAAFCVWIVITGIEISTWWGLARDLEGGAWGSTTKTHPIKAAFITLAVTMAQHGLALATSHTYSKFTTWKEKHHA